MKKTIALLLAVAMLATLTACGKKDENNSGNTGATQQETTTTTNRAGDLGENYNDATFSEW